MLFPKLAKWEIISSLAMKSARITNLFILVHNYSVLSMMPSLPKLIESVQLVGKYFPKPNPFWLTLQLFKACLTQFVRLHMHQAQSTNSTHGLLLEFNIEI